MTHPTAFLCWSEDDVTIAERLATDLVKMGVDVWWSKWEIPAGDSLRRKIDEGIDGCQSFLALLTPNSMESEWVKIELDTALINRIQLKSKLIPILSGVEHDQVPATLRGIVFVPLDPYEKGLRRLLDACYGTSEKPPLSPVPARFRDQRPSDPPFSPIAWRLARLLNEQSREGLSRDPTLEVEEVRGILDLSEEECARAAHELKDFQMVDLDADVNAKSGFRRIASKPKLFFETDLHFQAWKTIDDAKQLAAALVNLSKSEDPCVKMSDLDAHLGWGPRRINPAAEYLVIQDRVKPSRVIPIETYAYDWLMVTTRTGAFADS